MKKVLLGLIILGFSHFSYAQDENQKDKKSEEIVIRNNGDKELNMTVQINGDSILVNGKPLSQFSDSDVTIRKRKIFVHDDDGMMGFNFDHNNFNNQWNDGEGNQHHQWRKDRGITKPFLGVTTEKATDGAKITEVVDASAAQNAGLKEDDIITKINDSKIDDPQTLSNVVTSFKPNDKITIHYKRNGKEKKVSATLGKWADQQDNAYQFHGPMMHFFQMPGMGQYDPHMQMFGDNGMQDMPDFSMLRQKKIGLKIQDTQDGKVKVLAVEDSSAAAKAGIQKDDIIAEIDGEKINNTDDARQQLHPEEGKSSYDIKVNRNGKEIICEVEIPRKLKTADL